MYVCIYNVCAEVYKIIIRTVFKKSLQVKSICVQEENYAYFTQEVQITKS